jgi:hypothetical protein
MTGLVPSRLSAASKADMMAFLMKPPERLYLW